MVVVVWLIYQPEFPAVPDIEVTIDGRLVSTFTVLVTVVVLPALSVDLKLIVCTPSDKDALGCHAPLSTDISALAKPDPVSEPFTEITTGSVTNQPFRPSGVGTTGLTVGGVISTFIVRVIVAEFPALSTTRKITV